MKRPHTIYTAQKQKEQTLSAIFSQSPSKKEHWFLVLKRTTKNISTLLEFPMGYFLLLSQKRFFKVVKIDLVYDHIWYSIKATTYPTIPVLERQPHIYTSFYSIQMIFSCNCLQISAMGWIVVGNKSLFSDITIKFISKGSVALCREYCFMLHNKLS